MVDVRGSFVGRFPFPINLYDCDTANPLGQITTFALSVLVAGVGVLAERYVMAMGVHHTDIDMRPVLQNSMKTLEAVVNFVVSAHTERAFQLLLPFKDSKRSDVITLGTRLEVDFANTWSCHAARDEPCNACEGCRERADAFSLAGLDDPQRLRGLEIPVHVTRE